jgi:hypothetical protein
MAAMSRLAFLRRLLGWSAGALVGGADGAGAAERPGADPGLAGLAADFPDELLRAEAGRLGLDPDTAGREEMLRAVGRALSGPVQGTEGEEDIRRS